MEMPRLMEIARGYTETVRQEGLRVFGDCVTRITTRLQQELHILEPNPIIQIVWEEIKRSLCEMVAAATQIYSALLTPTHYTVADFRRDYLEAFGHPVPDDWDEPHDNS